MNPADRYVLDHATEVWTTDPISAVLDFVLNARTAITVSPAGEPMPNDPCPPDCNSDSRQNERQNPQPRERVLRSTRAFLAEKGEDARRDFDGFDVDEELARMRVALADGSMVSSAFIREAFENIDEWLVRDGDLPRAWNVPVVLPNPMPCLYSDSERLLATAADLAECEWSDETLRLRAIVFLARTGQRMRENDAAVEANRESAERQFEALREAEDRQRADRVVEATREMEYKRLEAEERRHAAERDVAMARETQRIVAQEVAASRGKRGAKGRRKAK